MEQKTRSLSRNDKVNEFTICYSTSSYQERKIAYTSFMALWLIKLQKHGLKSPCPKYKHEWIYVEGLLISCCVSPFFFRRLPVVIAKRNMVWTKCKGKNKKLTRRLLSIIASNRAYDTVLVTSDTILSALDVTLSLGGLVLSLSRGVLFLARFLPRLWAGEVSDLKKKNTGWRQRNAR